MIRVHLTGGAPWGFRLQGGEGTGLPVTISKVRRRSKAHLAKLQEGDEIVTINARSCKGISRDVAMTYIDNATESLDLEINRGEQNNNLANTANDVRQQTQPTSMTITQEPGVVKGSQSVRKRTVIQTTTTSGGKTQKHVKETVTEKHGDEESTKTTQETTTLSESDNTLINGVVTESQPTRKRTVINITPSTGRTQRESEDTVVETHGDDDTTKSTQESRTDSQADSNDTISNGDPGTVQFKYHAPKFSPTPLASTPKPGVWSPGNQPRQEPSTTTYRETVTTHEQTPLRAKVPAPNFHASKTTTTTTTVTSKPGVWQPGKTSTPKLGQEVEITFSPGMLPTNEIPITPIVQTTQNEAYRPEETAYCIAQEAPHEPYRPEETAYCIAQEAPPEEPEKKDNPSILDDPSLILAGLGPQPSNIETKRRAKSKIEMHRPFSYHGFESKTETDLTKEDARKICKQIADLLMFPSNKQARGAKMFAKRRRKAAKYTVEGFGQRPLDEYETESLPDLYQSPMTPITPFQPLTPQPPPPPPILDIHDEGYDPSSIFKYDRVPSPRSTGAPVTPKAPRTITIEPTNFRINLKDKTKCAHVAVTPDICGMLAHDLKGIGGRAQAMFAKRQQRVQKFVVDESNVKSPEAIHDNVEPTTPTGGIKVTLKGVSTAKPSDQRPTAAKHKTPWEAAMESPLGLVDRAFEHLDTGPTKVEVAMPKHMLPSAPMQKLPPVTKPKPKSPSAQSTPPVPAIRPKFKVSGTGESEKSGSAFEQNYSRKIKGWSPIGNGGDQPSSSPALSDFSGPIDTSSPVLPKQTQSPSSSFTDYNRKPRAWTPGSSNHSPAQQDFRPIVPNLNSTPETEMLESEDL